MRILKVLRDDREIKRPEVLSYLLKLDANCVSSTLHSKIYVANKQSMSKQIILQYQEYVSILGMASSHLAARSH